MVARQDRQLTVLSHNQAAQRNRDGLQGARVLNGGEDDVVCDGCDDDNDA